MLSGEHVSLVTCRAPIDSMVNIISGMELPGSEIGEEKHGLSMYTFEGTLTID